MKADPQRVLFLLGLGTAVSLLGDATLYTVLPDPEIASQVGVSLAMVGILLGVNRAVRLVLNGPVGLLYDRMPRRGLLVTSLFLGTLSSVIYAIGSGFWPLFVGRVLWGLAWSLLWVGGNTVILDISTDENRGRFSGQYQMWFFLGVASSSFLGGLLTDRLGFHGGLWVSAGLIGVAALIWLFFLPETRPADFPIDKQSDPDRSAQPFPWVVVIWAALPFFAMRFVFVGVVASTSILWLSGFFEDGIQLFGSFLPIATMTGSYVALRTLLSIASAPLAGRLSDKLGGRWMVLAVGLSLGAVGVWMMGSSLFIPALIGAFIAALTGGSVQSLVPAIAGDRVEPAQRGRALGVIFTIGDLGSTLAPLFALNLLDAEWMTLNGIYRSCAILFAAIAVFALTQISKEPRVSVAST